MTKELTVTNARETIAELLSNIDSMNKDTNALSVLDAFRSLRWAVLGLESAIMSDIFPTSKETK